MATIYPITPPDGGDSVRCYSPFLDVYSAQSERPPELEDIDPRELTPYTNAAA